MKLSNQDADLFFRLMFPLHLFANQQLGIIPDVDTVEDYLACPMEQKLSVRKALYEKGDLIDVFIQKNPHQLSPDNLAIIAKWKAFIAGEFYIERMLKKYAVFIGNGENVYGVLGLNQAFQEIFPPGHLPVYTRAVLLPFKGMIVYDGFLEPYNISFGGGIRARLKETYMAARQNVHIVESLEPELQPVQTDDRPVKDWRPEIDALSAEAQKLRAGTEQPPIQRPTFALVKASLELAQCAVQEPDDIDALWKYWKKVERSLRQVETVLHRSERYR